MFKSSDLRVNGTVSEGRGAGEAHPAARARLTETEFAGVKHQSPARVVVVLRAVEHIADDGVAHVGRVHAELVRPPCQRNHAQSRPIGFQRQHGPVRDRLAAPVGVDDLVRPVVDVRAHRDIDGARIAAQDSFDKRDVGFLHEARLELAGEFSLGIGIEAQDNQAGSIHIEAMNDKRAGGVWEEGRDPGRDTVFVIRGFSGDG